MRRPGLFALCVFAAMLFEGLLCVRVKFGDVSSSGGMTWAGIYFVLMVICLVGVMRFGPGLRSK